MDTRTNKEWLDSLRAAGGPQASAIADLRALLLRGALYSLRRTQYDLSRLDGEAVYQLAEDSAQDALLAVLAHLDDFRGESKFTTWAYKFAINVALMKARHEAWKQVSLDQLLDNAESRELPLPDKSRSGDPEHAAWQEQVRETVREVIRTELTARQREVLVAMVFDEAPMDEVASHFGVNRNAIYKVLHDARLKLKRRLEARGLLVDEILDVFAKK